jgi:hypothetical protein
MVSSIHTKCKQQFQQTVPKFLIVTKVYLPRSLHQGNESKPEAEL